MNGNRFGHDDDGSMFRRLPDPVPDDWNVAVSWSQCGRHRVGGSVASCVRPKGLCYLPQRMAQFVVVMDGPVTPW